MTILAADLKLDMHATRHQSEQVTIPYQPSRLATWIGLQGRKKPTADQIRKSVII